MIPMKKLQEFMAEGTIQIAPLAYMRGRTWTGPASSSTKPRTRIWDS